jgi:uncharacterized protein DUF6364
MQTKLTLRLEQQLIERVKQHARREGKSLSQIVADYFRSLIAQPEQDEVPPITHTLHGLLKPSKLDERNYKKYLREKYR